MPQIDGCAGYSATPIELFELDLAIDNQLQAGLTQGQCDLDRQLLLAGQAAFESASRTVFSTSRCAVIPNSLAHALDRDAPAGVGRVARGGLSRDGIGRGIAAENFPKPTESGRPSCSEAKSAIVPPNGTPNTPPAMVPRIVRGSTRQLLP